MNTLKGSAVAKILAWTICIGSAVAAVFFGGLMLIGIEEQFYGHTYEETIEKLFRNVNVEYSNEAFSSMINGRNNDSLAEKGFKYGVLDGNLQLKDVNFNDSAFYVRTNLTEEEIAQLDNNELFMCFFVETENGRDYEPYGYISEHGEEKLSSMAEEFGKQVTVDWEGQYADAVCYDVEKGIFYYRSEGRYYPAIDVLLPYISENGDRTDYTYVYDFDAGAYRFMERLVWPEEWAPDDQMPETEVSPERVLEEEEVPDDQMPETEVQSGQAIEAILQGKGTNSLVDLSQLEKTSFNHEKWHDIELDMVRQIEGAELTIIDSKEIDENSFETSPRYYLDDNYTLHVADVMDAGCYWVASLVPKSVPVTKGESGYVAAGLLAGLFYSASPGIENSMIVLVILMLAAFLFLAFAAGHRKNKEGLVLTWFDCLPLELFTAGIGFALAGVFIMAVFICRSWVTESNPSVLIKPLGLLGACGAALALWYALSICVRVKCGKWWRNTILYRIYCAVRGVVAEIAENWNLLRKLFMLVCVIAVLELWMICATTNSEEWIPYWMLEKAVLYAGIFLLAIQMYELQKAGRRMAEGDLFYKVDTSKMFWECKKHGENLNKIGEGMSKAVDERMKSERMKTELITNVSHDIKTPLTSIINYVDLLGKEELHNEKAAQYLEVLDRQSSKLKKLTEDLVEASKAAAGNLPCTKEMIEAGVFLTQTVGEFEEKMQSAELELIVNKTEENTYILADGRHLWRVVDNLMNNICKYAQPHSRVYVNLDATERHVRITFRNMSRYPLNINSEELTERFVRGDKSRSTEGHGLGLSIAKSLMDLMGGKMEIVVDGDLFKVVLGFDREKEMQI